MDKPDLSKLEEWQKKLESEIAEAPGVLGIGIGLNEAGDNYSLNVFVEDEKTVLGLPKTIGDVDIVYRVVGELKAL